MTAPPDRITRQEWLSAIRDLVLAVVGAALWIATVEGVYVAVLWLEGRL